MSAWGATTGPSALPNAQEAPVPPAILLGGAVMDIVVQVVVNASMATPDLAVLESALVEL